MGIRSGLTMAALGCLAAGAAQAAEGACALLTASAVSAVLGVPVGEGAPPMPTLTQLCAWREAGKPAGAGRNADVTVIDEHKFTIYRTPRSIVTVTPEPGVGDEAFWSVAPGMVPQLVFRKGSHYIMLRARTALLGQGSDAEKDKAADRKLAAEILKRL
ncbi:MAG: hypothetical protein JSR54_04585 [Proteobacteria bacterium]|nr:hypothetical protein [Pseudomonadota bacterium]